MDEDARWLDGNALAGTLLEVFGEEMTALERRCQACCAQRALGSYRAYVGAGVVLRCPGCGAPGLRVVQMAGRFSVRWSGPGPTPSRP